MKNENETEDSLTDEGDEEEEFNLKEFLEENRKEIMWGLAILLAFFVIWWAIEFNTEMDWSDQCKEAGLEYKYSLTCVGVNEVGLQTYYGKVRLATGQEVMHYYGLKDLEGNYEFEP